MKKAAESYLYSSERWVLNIYLTVLTLHANEADTIITRQSSETKIASIDIGGFGNQINIAEIPCMGNLQVLQLPAGLNVIEEEAFEGLACEAVIIPDGCTAIGSRAFANCTGLVYVRIPANVTSLAADAFTGCPDVVIDRIGQ